MKKFDCFTVVRAELSALLIMLLALFAVLPARAQSSVTRNFIGGGFDQNGQVIPGFNGYLQTTLGQTNLFGAGATYARGLLITNLTVTITNPANSLIITGYVSQTIPNFVSNTAAISDCALWGNRDGSVANCSISVDINGNGPFSTNGTTTAVGDPTFTNAITFTFAPYFGSPGYVAGAGGPPMGGTKVATWTGNTFSFQVSGNGTNDVYVSTNVPTGILQGAIGLRLTSIVSSANAGNTNGQIVGVWLNGFQSSGGSVAMNGGSENNYASLSDDTPRFTIVSDPPGKFSKSISVSDDGKVLSIPAESLIGVSKLRLEGPPIPARMPTHSSRKFRSDPKRHLSELMIRRRV